MRTLSQWLLHAALLALLLGSGHRASAQGAECVVSSAPNVAVSEQDTALPLCSELYPVDQYKSDASRWRIGFGGGVGQRSNPLLNSDDIPIYGVIQLSYFGERFFFDNGDFGLFLGEGENWNVNAIAGIGGERSFYSFLNSGSIGFTPSSLEGQNSPDALEAELQPLPTAPDRDFTADGGIEWLHTLGATEMQVQLLTDISGQHNGQEVWFSLALPVRNQRWEWVPSVGFNYKSARAANYYYGVAEDEVQPGLPAYEVNAAASPFVRMTLKYQLNAHWKLVSVLSYEHLANEITDSPAVEDDHVQTVFAGLYYEF